MTLIELLVKLLGDDEALAEFKDDPDGFLKSCGIEKVSADDVKEAIVLLDDQDYDSHRRYDTGDNHIDNHIKATPPPAKHHGESDHDHAIRYINTYITENHIDDRDTITDNSVNQVIDTGGGDFDQEIDIDSTVASGDGAVAAGGDIDGSTIVSGDDNQVGAGNVSGDGNVVGAGNRAVTGNDSTTAFGQGDANSTSFRGDVELGRGAALSAGGDAVVDNTDNSINDSFKDESETAVSGSGNYGLTVDASTNDSNNLSEDTEISRSFNDEETHETAGSGNRFVSVNEV